MVGSREFPTAAEHSEGSSSRMGRRGSAGLSPTAVLFDASLDHSCSSPGFDVLEEAVPALVDLQPRAADQIGRAHV